MTSRPAIRAHSPLSLILAAGLASTALAGPDGASVVSGTATFDQAGATTTITASDDAIINYNSFDIGATETVNFVLPGTDASVLNRILGGSPTNIDGTLLSNGRVYFVNPAGVIFGQGSVVNVGALYAAAANISNEDFLNHRDNFTGATGLVENNGTITAGFVGLIGAQVVNHGTIDAGNGAIVMASGNNIYLSERLGQFHVRVDAATDAPLASDAPGPALAAGDMFTLASYTDGTMTGSQVHVASAGSTTVSGSINADGLTGGLISLSGADIALRGASLSASGVSGGGQIAIGDERTSTLSIDAASVVSADALDRGDGGSVLLWSNDLTTVDGLLTARAGANAGDGGFIETSSAGVVSVSRLVDATSTHGRGGTWLVDPDEVIINDNGNAGSGQTAFSDDMIEAALNAGLSFVIVSDGTITLLSGVTIDKTSGGEARFRLVADDTITLNGSILNTSGSDLHLDLDAGNRIALNGAIDLNHGALSAVATHITLGMSEDEISKQGLGHRTAHEHDAGFGHLTHDEGVTNHNGHKFHTDPAVIEAGVVELLASETVTGQARITTTSSVGALSDMGFAVLSESLQAEMLANPANLDLAVLVDAVDTAFFGEVIRTSSGGGVRMRNTGELYLEEIDFRLDGRFLQQGATVANVETEIFTTNDDITFESDMALLGETILRTYGGFQGEQPGQQPRSEPTITLFGRVDGNAHLTADALLGSVDVRSEIGGREALDSIRFRGSTIDVHSNVTTQFRQAYIAQTARFHGGTLLTIAGLDEGDLRFDGLTAPIEVLGDGDLEFAGNTLLLGDLVVRTAGYSADDRGASRGDRAFFTGTIDSDSDGLFNLTVDSGDAQSIFCATIGTGVGSGNELGFLDVTASEARLWGSIYSNGMNFFAPLQINSDAEIHTGTGVAWFGDDIYSDSWEGYDIAFLYTGDPEVRLGENRTPFKFTGHIGAKNDELFDDEYGYGGGEFNINPEYAFGSILFGENRETPADAASFLFADRAQPGDALTPGYNGDEGLHVVYAYDEIWTGRGEKTTSFESLFLATGEDEGDGQITISDLNVLGDLALLTDRLFFQVREAGAVEGLSTEQARIDGNAPTLISDFAMEIIVSGDVFATVEPEIDPDATVTDGPLVLLLSSDFFESLGPVSESFLSDLVVFDSIDGSLFERLIGETGLYGYDLALTSLNKKIDPNLGLGFNGDDRFDPRYTRRYIADAEVLDELALNPHAFDATGEAERARLGSGVIADNQQSTAPTTAGVALTLDRLSYSGVTRLVERYVAMLGERVAEDSTDRARTDEVRSTFENAWSQYRAAGGQAPSGLAEWAADFSPAALTELRRLGAALDAIDTLGLSPYEAAIARSSLLAMVRPSGMESGTLERAVDGLIAVPTPQDADSLATR